jgi:hypothetical protein
MPKPVNQFIVIRGMQDIGKAAVFVVALVALGQRQQMQVMIA